MEEKTCQSSKGLDHTQRRESGRGQAVADQALDVRSSVQSPFIFSGTLCVSVISSLKWEGQLPYPQVGLSLRWNNRGERSLGRAPRDIYLGLTANTNSTDTSQR